MSLCPLKIMFPLARTVLIFQCRSPFLCFGHVQHWELSHPAGDRPSLSDLNKSRYRRCAKATNFTCTFGVIRALKIKASDGGVVGLSLQPRWAFQNN